jgi:heat shock protein HslJ
MNKNFTYLIVLIYILSCNTVRQDNTSNNLKRKWMLTRFEDFSKNELVDKKAYLDLTAANASSKMGCNSLSFSYKINDDNTIQFSNGISTRMACPDMKLEYDFSKKITSVTSYEIKGQQLILKTNTGETIEFVAEDWD